jgi:hypothetical protein
MKTLIKVSLLLTIIVLWAGSAVPLLAATTIFDNSTNDQHTRLNPGTSEVGDEILLASTFDRYLTSFSFEYYGLSQNVIDPSKFTGDVQAKVTFYLNDGAAFNGYSMPGTAFWTSDWFSIPGVTGRSTMLFTEGVDWAANSLFIPTSDMTWSIQFTGMETGDVVGLDVYSPPTVGQDYPDYWLSNGDGGWTLVTNSVPVDFAAKMQAVPEPSTLALSILGGVGILALARRLGRKA